MFNKNSNQFLFVEFKEHPIVDFQKHKGNLFDVSADGLDDFPSDFMDGNRFDHEQYCICLLDIAFALSRRQLSDFLNYQCRQMKIPFLWLIQFKTLLRKNREFDLISYPEKDMDLLARLLMEKRDILHGLIRNEDNKTVSELLAPFPTNVKFDIIRVKEELEDVDGFEAKELLLTRRRKDYFQEQEHNAEADFIKSVDLELDFINDHRDQDGNLDFKPYVFKGPPLQLVYFVIQLMGKRRENGDLYFDGSRSHLAKIICLVFREEDGSFYRENTIRTYINNYFNGGKRWIDNDAASSDN